MDERRDREPPPSQAAVQAATIAGSSPVDVVLTDITFQGDHARDGVWFLHS